MSQTWGTLNGSGEHPRRLSPWFELEEGHPHLAFSGEGPLAQNSVLLVYCYGGEAGRRAPGLTRWPSVRGQLLWSQPRERDNDKCMFQIHEGCREKAAPVSTAHGRLPSGQLPPCDRPPLPSPPAPRRTRTLSCLPRHRCCISHCGLGRTFLDTTNHWSHYCILSPV